MATATVVPPLRVVRKSQGLGLRETARRAGIDHAQLSRVERGEAGLSVDALYRLARVLNIRQLADLLEQYIGEERSA
jgi:transcriptional regulator with XRE-family HTH domain